MTPPPPSAVLLSVDLLGLLNWRSHPKDLDQILQRLMEVEGGEIVKVSRRANRRRANRRRANAAVVVLRRCPVLAGHSGRAVQHHDRDVGGGHV